MKTALLSIAAILAAFAAPGALAQVSSVDNTAVIGAQVNTQNGLGNIASNEVFIGQTGSASAIGIPGLAPSYAAAASTATVGAQVNNQIGAGNYASNAVGMFQHADVLAAPFGSTRTANSGLVGAQTNSQIGVANIGHNSVALEQSAFGDAGLPFIAPYYGPMLAGE